MPWEHIAYGGIHDLASRLLTMAVTTHAQQSSFHWRGESELFDTGIVGSIARDRSILTADTEVDRLRQERAWYAWWRDRMHSLLLQRDRRQATRADGLPELDWLNFAAHHGCRTRLVDWTESPWAALYFACSRSPNREGRVWCFDAKPLWQGLDERWDMLGVPRLPGSNDRDVAIAAFTRGASRWIVTQYNYRAPTRMAAQHGLFTLASRADDRHDEILDEFVPDGSKFEIRISPEFKPHVLRFLQEMGIHHESLQYPMLDQVAGDVAMEFHPS